MKIAIIGPGIMQIPPVGWGAVEILIWDYKQTLEKYGHTVLIINTKNINDIINQCNNFNPDFVHIQYDEFWELCDKFKCKNVAITSHYGYITQKNKHGDYSKIFNGFLSKNVKLFALSPEIANFYKQHNYPENKIFVIPNGVRADLFKYNSSCVYPDKSICLAKIEDRKRQYLIQDNTSIFFAGNIVDSRFKKQNYLGEWNKQYLYDNLTNYANLILLSDGEAHPLVCMEAMVAGLGLIISEYATANLNLSLPFINVIPENRITDIDYINSIIDANRKTSISMRDSIRNYVISNFSWDHIVTNYYIPSILK